MTGTVRFGQVEVGAGAPTVIVPLVAGDVTDLVAQAAAARGAADVLEWRIDRMRDTSPDAVLTAGRALVQAADGTPLLATYRTAAEGGAQRPDTGTQAYAARYRALLGARLVAAVDVETALGEAVVAQVVAAAHQAGAAVVGSSHDTVGTPPADQIVARLVGMAAVGVDVCKVAVTPHSPDDVLTLLAATRAASQRLDQPLVTVAMGPLGLVTRLAGEPFGSAATFGTVGPSSAPGQVDAVALRQVVDLVHAALTGVPTGADQP
ncbi:MAG: type I 3-dehydroquinate dehydratase [Micrococcales bacterium]|nr:type I 3-dehydroquinate dehydratase [Micrococcales bacterium]